MSHFTTEIVQIFSQKQSHILKYVWVGAGREFRVLGGAKLTLQYGDTVAEERRDVFRYREDPMTLAVPKELSLVAAALKWNAAATTPAELLSMYA